MHVIIYIKKTSFRNIKCVLNTVDIELKNKDFFIAELNICAKKEFFNIGFDI